MTAENMDVSTSHGRIRALARAFAWATLFALPAFFINNVLKVSFGWPGAEGLFVGQANWQSVAQLALWFVAVVLGIQWGLRRGAIPMRADSARISNFNAYLVRAAFWAVLLVGLADFVVSFLRVENLLAGFVGDKLAADLARPAFRGPWLHMPLIALGALIALFSRSLGIIWLAALIVCAELTIAVSRFVFSYEQAFMADLVRFWYAALFLFASAYTLLEDGHVRVDVFYAGLNQRTKGKINAVGSVLMGILFCWVILGYGMDGRSSVVNSPLLNWEVSQSGFGLYTKYLMAVYLAVFAVIMMIQFVAMLLEAVADWSAEPGGRATVPSGH